LRQFLLRHPPLSRLAPALSLTIRVQSLIKSAPLQTITSSAGIHKIQGFCVEIPRPRAGGDGSTQEEHRRIGRIRLHPTASHQSRLRRGACTQTA
jgi:hypothetical protein